MFNDLLTTVVKFRSIGHVCIGEQNYDLRAKFFEQGHFDAVLSVLVTKGSPVLRQKSPTSMDSTLSTIYRL